MDRATIQAGKAKCRTHASNARSSLQSAMREIDASIAEAHALKGVDAHKTVSKLESIRGDLQSKINAISGIQ